MAAFPFGNHPELARYIVWAEESGCTVQQGVTPDAQSVTKITSPDGKHVIIVGIQHRERLTPSMIAHYDRRLGMKSPFASINGDVQS